MERLLNMFKSFVFPAGNSDFSTILSQQVQQLFQKGFFFVVYFVLVALAGIAAGWLMTILLALWMTPSVSPVNMQTSQMPLSPDLQRPLADYQVILDRNIFNPGGTTTSLLSGGNASGVTGSSAAAEKQPAPALALKDLSLVGTVTAGLNSLAVIRQGKQTQVYGLGDKIGDGLIIKDIARQTVILVSRDGARHTLIIEEKTAAPLSGPPINHHSPAMNRSASFAGVKQVGENSWVIPSSVAEQARDNFNELLKQARMEPRIVAGKTDGFIVRMLRANSLLDQLGLRRGDVVMAINNLALDSPEKALQIFQQLREAQNIKVDLLRNDRPLTLEYETD